MTTYIVSGYMRSGTSMMMRALTEGGLTPAFADGNRQYMNDRHGDENYKPNPAGYYELNRQDYQQPGFPRQYEGKLIKMLMNGINRIVAGDYKIVFMRRDFEEIRQSYEAFFQNPLNMTEEMYTQRADDALGILYQRKDCEVMEMWYRDVIEYPREQFHLLQYLFPIDVDKAAAIVDKSQLRFRKENLTIGIT